MNQRFAPERSCHNKKGWPSQKQARDAAYWVQDREPDPIHVYHCGWCGKWHIGHLPRSRVKGRGRRRRASYRRSA